MRCNYHMKCRLIKSSWSLSRYINFVKESSWQESNACQSVSEIWSFWCQLINCSIPKIFFHTIMVWNYLNAAADQKLLGSCHVTNGFHSRPLRSLRPFKRSSSSTRSGHDLQQRNEFCNGENSPLRNPLKKPSKTPESSPISPSRFFFRRFESPGRPRGWPTTPRTRLPPRATEAAGGRRPPGSTPTCSSSRFVRGFWAIFEVNKAIFGIISTSLVLMLWFPRYYELH